jgi:GH24 family phage-related lysozyme (muramidase)
MKLKKPVLIGFALGLAYFIYRLSQGQSLTESLNPLSMITDNAKEKGKKLTKESEGLASKLPNKLSYVLFPALASPTMLLYAYLDSVGKPTIGFGTTYYPQGAAVKMGDTCTVLQANEYFEHEWEMKYNELLGKVPPFTTEGQLSSLTDFSYNKGRTALYDSTLWSMFLSGADKQSVADQFDRWVYGHVNGLAVKIKGLVNRAASEKQIFLS